MKSMLYSKKGIAKPQMGVDIAMSAIFILAIGLTVVNEVFTNLTTGNNSLLTGVSATVLGYAPLIVVAVFIYGVARIGGVL